jgi:hypothetical protein
MNQKILLYVGLTIFVLAITSIVVFFVIFQHVQKNTSDLPIPETKTNNGETRVDEKNTEQKPKYDIQIIDESQTVDQEVVHNDYELTNACVIPGMNIPDNAVVFVAGGYSGKSTDFQIDDSGDEAGRIDVIVNHAQDPVILILGAYEPTVWNVLWTEHTNIIGVYVSGYNKQVIAGLKRGTPTLINSYEDNDNGDGLCGDSFYVDKDQISHINSVSQEMFKRDVQKAYLAKDGEVVVGDGVQMGVKVFTSNAHPTESFFDRNAPLSGKAGLDDAVQKGIIRLAKREDVDAWERMQNPNAPELVGDSNDQSYIESRLSMGGVYVVLKEFQYPAGLFGANSVIFIIPKGVSHPTGNPGHCEIYDMNGGTCSGPGCYAY